MTMTDEQRARELLAAQHECEGFADIAKHIRAGYGGPANGISIRAIVAALAHKRAIGELDSHEKYDGTGTHSETIETRARIGERYLEAYESALSSPLLAEYMPADCPTELLLDLLNELEVRFALARGEQP